MERKYWCSAITTPSPRNGIGNVVLRRPVRGRLLSRDSGFYPMNRSISMKTCLMRIFTGMSMEIQHIKIFADSRFVFAWSGRNIGQLILRTFERRFLEIKSIKFMFFHYSCSKKILPIAAAVGSVFCYQSF